MKKYLIVFAVALGFPFALQILSYFWLLAQMFYPTISSSLEQTFGLLYSLARIFGAFALFYFLGKIFKIEVTKPVILALFFGFLVNLTVSYLYIPLSAGQPVFAYIGHFVIDYVDIAFQLFFPAFAALLFVELRARVSNDLSP